MQLTLPLFSSDVTLISTNVGVICLDGIVFYQLNGLPMYSHPEGDFQAFRFFTSNLVNLGLCKKTEVMRAFSITIDQVNRACKIYKKEGESGFFRAENRHGHCHKLVGENLTLAQKMLDDGKSNVQVAKACHVQEGSVRYSIKQGYLKKKNQVISIEAVGSEPNLRSELGTQSPMGISTTNTFERSLASFGQIKGFTPEFGAHNSVDFGGVLLLIPALLAQGLMKIKETHTMKEGYYTLENIVLTLSFMALCRIKNPQQLSQYKSGEMGKLLGYDRIAEMKCLRNKMKELFENNQTFALNNLLVQDWIGGSDDLILYTDGHVRVYNGYKAQLPKKHVSRQKLCLAATADFWLNDSLGMPLMKWTGDLNEKLQHMIEFEMIPKLLEQGVIARATAETTNPVCTLVFDREAYAPDFFERLWSKHRISIISYRKNVKDMWEASEFKAHNITDSNGQTVDTMLLCEKEVVLKGHIFREIRKLSDSNHQTAIITTNPTMELAKVAVRMFARWLQENFFKYMIADYSLDHIYQYGVEEIELSEEIVNPAYRSIYNQHKKEKEKLGRLEKELVKNVKLDQDSCLDTFKQNVTNKAKLVEKIEQKRIIVADLSEKRDKLPKKIKLADLPEESRYTTLKKESSYFMATLKMICYRAETALANMLESKFRNAENEKRSLVKEIIFTSADIKPDLEKKQLVVTLHSMSTPMKNQIVNQLCQELNDSETVFPGTDLTLVYKSIAY